MRIVSNSLLAGLLVDLPVRHLAPRATVAHLSAVTTVAQCESRILGRLLTEGTDFSGPRGGQSLMTLGADVVQN